MVYKICLASTHGTGKTTLMAAIEKEFRRKPNNLDVERIEEISRRSRRYGLPINTETTLESQIWILHQQFADEILYTVAPLGNPDNLIIICDRGLDNYCYLKRKFGENAHALQMVLGHYQMFPYNRIYLLPIIDDSITDDGTRSLDQEFRKEIDLEVKNFFETYNIPNIRLPIPEKEDEHREEWTKIIVNQTLQDLNRTEGLME